ncbi:MAG: hypothetical protein PHE80_02745 [Candidatus Omnitrophica bacterium]|nr:hypothetical protein [Candidatus Omnitrophota bacterium]MDD5737975.1 hypothetical protein [Candidatus Omnitrophota bacterium]
MLPKDLKLSRRRFMRYSFAGLAFIAAGSFIFRSRALFAAKRVMDQRLV